MMGEIYPFAGEWRAVDLHKELHHVALSAWRYPAADDVFARDVLSRSPFLSDDEEEVYAYVSEVLNEIPRHPSVSRG